MADTSGGYGLRPDEPQCYNCGTMGHWAVACPEPTRQTPAGLEAWRNTSHAAAHSHHPKDHRGSQKKSRGPIITRYAPPQGQPASYPPNSGHYGSSQYPGASHYPPAQPPPPPPPPQTSHYPQPPPPPPPPTYASYSNPQYSSGYNHPPPSYSPQSAPPPGYGTTPPAPLPSRPDYGAPRPPPPPHSSASPYPPSYDSYTPPIPPGAPPGLKPAHIGPPPRTPGGPPVPNASGHGRSPSRPPNPRSQSSRLPKSQKKGHQPPNRIVKPHGTVSAPPKGLGLGIMTPSERVVHGLPPKPPAPIKDRQDTRRDHRNNKKKQDQPRGNRDNRHRDQSGNRRSSNHKQNRHGRRHSSQGQNVPKPSPSRQDNPEEEGTRADGDREMSAPRSEQTRESGETRVTPDKAQTSEREPEQVKEQAPTKADANDNFESPWEADAIFAEPEPTHPPDEVGRPLPSTYTEDVVLPRKWDSKCIESEYFNPDNLEEFTRPIHETKYWQDMEFDPAFVRGGKFPNGELLRDFRWENGNPEQETAVQKRPKDDDHQRNESPAQGRRGSHDGSLKRKRSPDTPPASSRGRKYRDSPSRERRHSNGRRDRRLSETYRPDASRYDDRPRGRSTLRDSEPRRRPSPDSRSISPASSRSSGLDSLDRELLGIETKDKDQLEEGRSRQETEKASKPKRRRVQLDSAYSRRW